MYTHEFSDQDRKHREDELSKIKKVSNELYNEIIPQEMQNHVLDEMNQNVFGVDTLQIYIERKLFHVDTILISEFSSHCFFWAQITEELQSIAYSNIYELMNDYGKMSDRELADLSLKWCIARFEGEWFRAYIIEVMAEDKLKVFFIDYGTSAIIRHTDTYKPPCPDEDIWDFPPLLIPCIVKDMTLGQYAKLKKLQYSSFKMRSMKLIENTFIFEVELETDEGQNLLEWL